MTILETILLTKIMISPVRRTEIKKVVLNTLLHSNYPYLPVDIKKICKSFDFIRLIPFSIHMKRRNLTYIEVCELCESEDACADYYASTGKYIIYYNDVITWKYIASNRYRWSIAHELGHILLNHHIDYKQSKIFRNNLSDLEYSRLETEADYFAQLILVPHAALLGFRIEGSRNIRIMCKISEPAAKRRYYEYIEWKSCIDAQDEYDRRIFYYYFNFIFKRKCKICGTGIIQRYGKHCPICGNKNTLEWGDGDMKKYPLLGTHENGKLKECPICENCETEIEGDYCQICGKYLVNKCSNINCSNMNILPSNARFCPICGHGSTFYNSDILNAWNFQFYDGFSNIPDGIDEDVPFN